METKNRDFLRSVRDTHVLVKSDGVSGLVERIDLHQSILDVDPKLMDPDQWWWMYEQVDFKINRLKSSKGGLVTWFRTYKRDYGENHPRTETQKEKLEECKEKIEYYEDLKRQILYQTHLSNGGIDVPYELFVTIFLDGDVRS